MKRSLHAFTLQIKPRSKILFVVKFNVTLLFGSEARQRQDRKAACTISGTGSDRARTGSTFCFLLPLRHGTHASAGDVF
eukprot:scaffold303_cov145-Skeletonema_dohrnii-CCMP3373.AAC.11